MYNRVGPQTLIALGLFVNAIAFYLLSRLSLDVGYWNIFFPQSLQGMGFGFIFVSLSTAVLSTIENPLMTAATGLYNVIRQIFSGVGIALAATFLTRGETYYRAILSEHVTVFRDIGPGSLHQIASLMSSRGTRVGDTDMAVLKFVERTMMRQASMLAYNHVFFLITLLFLFSIPLALLIRDSQRMETRRSQNLKHNDGGASHE